MQILKIARNNLCLVACLFALSSRATTLYTETVDGVTWTYTVTDGKASLGGGLSSSTAVARTTSGTITIPSSLNGYPVASISDFAFAYCNGLASVTIPESVTSIGTGAFRSCSGLMSIVVAANNPQYISVNGLLLSKDGRTLIQGVNGNVEVPDTVTSIGSQTFFGCSGLTSVTMPNCVTNIGESAFSYCSGLASITIPDCVTSIGNNAFNLCRGMTSVTIPDSVTNIGEYAFNYCDGLTSLTIGNSVTNIGEYAFSSCSGLTSVTIPDSVISIGRYAFSGCSGLTSVTIGNGVTSIGAGAFRSCSGLMSILVAENNPQYISANGLLLSKDCRTLIQGINGSVTVPDTVTSIGSQAFFGCSGLTSIMIPDSVTSIGAYAFSNCSDLSSVAISDSVTSLGNYAFSGCNRLTSITIPGSVTSIGMCVFSHCSDLTSVVIPDSVTSIGDSAFSGCEGLTSITIPDSVTSIGAYAFYSCYGLTSVTIPDSVTSIGDSAFSMCISLTEMTISQAVCQKRLSSIINNVDSLTNIIISTNVTMIGNRAFDGCSGLTSITIPDSVTSIGGGAFSSCYGLTSITIPDSVTSIGAYAFYSCYGLKSVTIPDSVTSIGDSAFSMCISLTEMTISQAVCQKRLSSIINNVDSLTNIIISTNVTMIGNRAFDGCSGLTSITIPDSVTSIGGGAFSSCYGLTSITIPDSVTSIGAYAFYYCIGLASVTIGNSVTNIGEYAFNSCSGLMSVAIPDSVTSIGGGAFSSCYGLTSITIPDSVTSIGDRAFSGCYGLTDICIPQSVTHISSSAFSECNNLSAIKVDAVNAKYKAEAGLLSTKDGKNLIRGFGSNITIPDGVESIESYVFNGCNKLTSVTIPDSVTNIEYGAFEHCKKLHAIYFKGNAPVVSSDAFYGIADDALAFVRVRSSGWGVNIPGVWEGIKIMYSRFDVGEQFPISYAGEDYDAWVGDAINESNFDFCIQEEAWLPAGAVVRIKKLTLASLNTEFRLWDDISNRSDASYIYLNGVRSDVVNGGTGALSDDNMIASNAETNDYALTFTFSTPCDIVVGKKYPAATGNSIGRVGTGLALLHSNGNLLYGSGADRASVRYIKTDSEDSVITTVTAKTMTGEDGWCPVYEIEAEVVSIEKVAFDYTAVSSNHTILQIADGWFKGSAYFAGGTPQNSLLRIGPSEKYKLALQTTASTCPHYNVDARTNSFSFAIYANVSQMPSTGKAVMVAFGHNGGNILTLYRNGEEVALALVDSAGGTIGETASVAAGEGYHLYVATCNPNSGEIALSLDGGAAVAGGSDGAVELGSGFQIGSVYGKMRSGFTHGTNMAIVKMLGYDAILSMETIMQLAQDYPTAIGGAFVRKAVSARCRRFGEAMRCFSAGLPRQKAECRFKSLRFPRETSIFMRIG